MTVYDLKMGSVRDVNRQLQMLVDGDRFSVENAGGEHSVAVGLMTTVEVVINGHVGYYCGGMNQRAAITVNGNAGPGLAENMMSGSVRVKGNASQYAAATVHGGLVVIGGDAAARCGISMKGGDIVVGGSVGHMSAFMAQSGNLVICGDAGDALGDSIYEAKLYVRGSVSSLGADCIEKPLRDQHKIELAELLVRAGMSGLDLADFKRYGSARKLYNFTIDNAGAY